MNVISKIYLLGLILVFTLMITISQSLKNKNKRKIDLDLDAWPIIRNTRSRSRKNLENHKSASKSRVSYHQLLNSSIDLGLTIKTYKHNHSLDSIDSESRNKRFFGGVNRAFSKVKNIVSKWSMSKKEAKELFDKYYQCQEAKVRSLLQEEFPIKAKLAVEGEKVRLTCQICYRPDVDADSQLPDWQFLRHEDTGLTKIVPSGRVKVSRDHSLVIKNIDVEDAGQYFCVERHDYAAVWQLDVFLTDRRRFVQLKKGAQQNDTFLNKRNLFVFTKWGSWSECNTCDRIGQRSRPGNCMVKKIYPHVPTYPQDFPLMALYPGGVPCHSTALPRQLRHVKEIKERESETLVSECNVPCATTPATRVVTDEDGSVIEVVKSGFFSIFEKPDLPKVVKRRVIYEPENSHLVLKCPGDLTTDQIRWQRGRRDVDPLTIRRQTNERVWVDQQRRLHLAPLLLSDTAVYNCWEKDRRVASIKVLVVDEITEELKLYISYAGLAVAVLGTVLLLVCLCCRRRNKEAR